MPLQNCCALPTSTSYLRAKVSLPSAPTRITVMPAGSEPSAADRILATTSDAAARVDAEGAQLNAAAVEVLNERRLAGGLIDRKHGNAVLAAGREFSRAGSRSRKGAVGQIDEFAVGMNVDRSGALRDGCFRIRQRLFDKERRRAKGRSRRRAHRRRACSAARPRRRPTALPDENRDAAVRSQNPCQVRCRERWRRDWSARRRRNGMF